MQTGPHAGFGAPLFWLTLFKLCEPFNQFISQNNVYFSKGEVFYLRADQGRVYKDILKIVHKCVISCLFIGILKVFNSGVAAF